MPEALHLEELNALLDSPACMLCDHRQIFHWENETTEGCMICSCTGFAYTGALSFWFPDVLGEQRST